MRALQKLDFVKVHLHWVWYYERSKYYLPDSLCVIDTDRGHGSDTAWRSRQVATNIITPVLRTQKLGSEPDFTGEVLHAPCLWQFGVGYAIISGIIHKFSDVLQPFLPGIRLANSLECLLRVMTFRFTPDVLSVLLCDCVWKHTLSLFNRSMLRQTVITV